jgi:hypothetical protein
MNRARLYFIIIISCHSDHCVSLACFEVKGKAQKGLFSRLVCQVAFLPVPRHEMAIDVAAAADRFIVAKSLLADVLMST